MLPGNVLSLVKKMVASEGSGGGDGGVQGGGLGRDAPEAGTALSKLRHTLTSGIHGTVTKLSPTRQGGPNINPEGSLSSSSSSSSAGVGGQTTVSVEERSLLQKVWDKSERFEPSETRYKPPPIATPTAPSIGIIGSGGGSAVSPLSSPQGTKPSDSSSTPTSVLIAVRAQRSPGSSCRVCVKTLKESEFFKVCSECGNKVCEDCASYSTQTSDDGKEETWNCSICRRRLSSRAKSDQTASSEGSTLSAAPSIMAAPVPPPSPGAPTALNLFSGIAAMTSSMAAPHSQGKGGAMSPSATHHHSSIMQLSTVTSGTSVSSASSPSLTITTTTSSSTLSTNTTTTTSNTLHTTPSTPTTEVPPAHTNGYPSRKMSRASMKQSSLDRTKSIERSRSRDESRDRRTPGASTPGPDGRRPREKSRERPVPRRRSDNDDEPPRGPGGGGGGGRATPTVRRARMSDYTLRDNAGPDDHLNFSRIHAAHSETDVSRSRKQSHANLHQAARPPEPSVPRTTAPEEPTGPRESESSGDEVTVNSWQSRGRRRSIVRQQSYEEDAEGETFTSSSNTNVNNNNNNNNNNTNTNASSSLSLWGGGELPVRRHSTQDPSRRDEALEGMRRTRDSLDVPQQRVHRHHSWDYDVTRDTLPISGIMASAGCGGSRHSSESDVSSEAASERGSSTALADQDSRRYSRSSIKRRSSYRASRGRNNDPSDPYDADDQSGALDSSSPLSPEIPTAGGGGGGVAAASSSRRSGTSSLEDDQWLYPAEDEYRSTRRRSSAVSEGGSRMLPTPPASPRGTTTGYSTTAATPPGSTTSGTTRISTSLEVNTSRELACEDGLRRQSSVTEGETIRIVIHDVDTDHRKGSSGDKGRRRVKIQRDLSDTAHRTRGLGMRVVGGKGGPDGHLFAYVVWTVPGGPAEQAGVSQGDKVLEWNGVQLTDRSFEEVCSIMEDSPHQDLPVHLLIEPSTDLRPLDYDEASALGQQKKGSLEGRIPLEADNDKSCSSRRKLPKIPSDMMREPVSGKLQVQLWYDQDKSHLIVTLVSAHDLRFRDSSTYGPPEAFVCLRLFPFSDNKMYSTGVAESSCKPLWNSSFIWENLSADSLMALTLELSVWDYVSDNENGFLGETLIDLRHAYLDDRPTWHRLQERRSRSANATPRGSIVSYDFTAPPIRRPSSVRSGSDDAEDSRNSSLDSGLLHPDLAWRESRSPSRRGSSLSEQAENEVYQLARSYPHSLPQSRRSSVAYQSSSSLELKAEELEARLSVSMSPLERRRSHSFRTSTRSEFLQSNEDIVRPRRASFTPLIRSNSIKNSSQPDLWVRKGSCSSTRPDEDVRTWSVSGEEAPADLGPGQVVPRGYRDILTDDFTLGEIHLELTLTKGQLEVVVSSARGLPSAASGQDPDTYVKTYLKDGERRIHKRKTRVTKHSCRPKFSQTLRYGAQDALGRSLLVMVWERQRGFEHNQGIGVAEISLARLEQGQRPLIGWYRLLPVSSVMRVDSDSGDSTR